MDGEYLLVKNKVVESTPLKKSEKDDIADYVLPKTNKKFLGFWRFYLQIYNLPNPDSLAAKKERQMIRINEKNQKITEYNATVTNPKKKKKLKKERLLFGEWLQKNGERPVLLDSLRIKKSKLLLAGYARNKGFFRAYVTDSVVFKKNKKAEVIYTVHRGPATYIDTIKIEINNPGINFYVNANLKGSKLKNNMKYDLQKLDDERMRLTEILKNNGYFTFNKEYLKFYADTVTDSGTVHMVMRLNNPDLLFPINGDTIRLKEHKKFKINEVFVSPNFLIHEEEILSRDTIRYNNYIFVYNNKKNYNQKIIAQSIFIEKDQYYSAQNEVKTQKALAELRNFKYIHIRFEPVSVDGKDGLLNCYIDLSPLPKQNLGVELQATNTAAANSEESKATSVGINISANYVNKNIFKGAELFEFKIFGGAELQFLDNSTGENILGPFNTLNFGTSVSLLTNQFLFPIKISKVRKWVKPKSRIALGYNFQLRPDYSRHVGSLNFGYEWSSSPKIKHILNIAEVSFVEVELSDAFKDYLNSVNDQFVTSSFIDHYIQGSSYTFQLNTQDLNVKKNFLFFRGNVQWAGNILNLVSIIGNDVPVNGQHTVFDNIVYAQYVRTEFDFRYYAYLHPYHSLAFRALFGVGVPYGNIRIMPFERAFAIGGSNDLRAWLPRTMGPGEYNDTGTVDQVGDMKMLFSAEYRGKIYRFLEGALFADFGNIWLLRQDSDRIGGEISSKFIEQLALGAGFGIRLNFGYFIFRFDVAFPFRDPRLPAGERWVIANLKPEMVRYNIAIGYPF